MTRSEEIRNAINELKDARYEDVVSEAYDRGYNLGYSDGYQDGTKGEETE